jgi:DNA (cytosine-5)-methyltransferase 1
MSTAYHIEQLSQAEFVDEASALVDQDQYQPTAIDLFSGCGGLTQGLKDAGFRVIGALEKDVLAADTYQLNHPEVRMWRHDIRELSPRVVKRALKLQTCQLDLLAGCPPCQGFSAIRTLQGKRSVDDPNNALLYRFLFFVKELKPKAVMMENVPALATDEERMGRFLSVLGSLGYVADRSIVKVLNAAHYGVPQRRRRMILLTSRLGRISFALPNPTTRTVRDAIGDLLPAGHSGDPLHDTLVTHAPEVLERIRSIPADGGSRAALGESNQLPCHQRAEGFKDIYGRMAWNKVSPTITGGCINPSKGRFLHPVEHRSITLREAALLQSFPPEYKISLSRGKNPAALLIGNALPPAFAKSHAASVRAFLWERHRCVFSTDVTNQQWDAIQDLLPVRNRRGGQRRKVDLRMVVNAILFKEFNNKSIYDLPNIFPPYTTLVNYYYNWRKSGLLKAIKDRIYLSNEDFSVHNQVGMRIKSRKTIIRNPKKTLVMQEELKL